MHSEFYNVALDRIRYSLVWEDSTTLYAGLGIRPTDTVLVIASAGCNALNALLRNPRQVVAIDLNPVQNKLLALKRHVILHHEHPVLRGLMGFEGPAAVRAAGQKLESTLPPALLKYWSAFFDCHPGGLLTAGRLEAYVTGFYPTLDPALQGKLRSLTQFEDVQAQRHYFLTELDASVFREQFIAYFDEQNLSKGRDPRLFAYARESGGEAFYNRLVQQVSTTLVGENFFFRFLFFGPLGMPERILPPCYQRKHYRALRAQLPKLTLVDGEAIDYLLSAEGAGIDKASLSNIFEYTSREEFEKVCHSLFTGRRRPLRFVFWNLLQEQGICPGSASRDLVRTTELPAQAHSCFYFRNVRVLESNSVPTAISLPVIPQAILS
jgi:S-adenosylmethionine-diacylglycerol 3-amino-3-carboxypropyl transferase